jgi:hypothetical protein
MSLDPLVYISLTSIHSRQESLLSVLKNLKLQTYSNIKICLWLSKEPYLLDDGFDACPMNAELTEYLNANTEIEVNWTPNTGPYRKFLPMLERFWEKEALIFTVDDDILIECDTVQLYVEAYTSVESRICSTSTYLVLPKGLQSDFTCSGIPISRDIMAIGCSGVLYNTKWFTDKRILDTALAHTICKHEDDLWYHIWMIHGNLPTTYLTALRHIDKCPDISIYNVFNSNNRSKLLSMASLQRAYDAGILACLVSVVPDNIKIKRLISFR